jgi:hypothetical protein
MTIRGRSLEGNLGGPRQSTPQRKSLPVKLSQKKSIAAHVFRGGLTTRHGSRASISVSASDGVVVRHATGIEDTDNKGYGDAVSNASAMAFKRASALFGLGRHTARRQGDDNFRSKGI